MKIAIASDDGKNISAHFGRTKGFQIYSVNDSKIENSEYLENTFTGHARGDHNEHSHNEHGGQHHGHGKILEALSDCEVVISNGMGQRIYNDLMTAGKKVFITDETTTGEAVEKYLKQELPNDPGKCCEDKH